MKKDIKPIDNGISIIQKLTPVSYYYDTDKYPYVGFDDRLAYGFIADDLEKVLPEMVKNKMIVLNGTNPRNSEMSAPRETDEFKMVNYVTLIPILTQAIKEQQYIIEQLEKRIEALEKK